MLSSARFQRALLGVLVVLLAAIAVVIVTAPRGDRSGSEVGYASSAFDGSSLPAHLRAADFTLRNQNGGRVSLARDRDHVVVMTFIHSLCRDDCPFMVEQIKGALNLLPDRGRGVRVIGVSVEPRQDTRANRRAFIARHEMTGRMEYVNGPLPVMRRVWKQYAIQPVTAHGDHSTFVLLISKGGYERVGFPAIQLTPGKLAHDIRVLQRRPA
jgi:cytochrome oxidase Cu insertion factor (SCO1/SenC/PrrC family)